MQKGGSRRSLPLLRRSRTEVEEEETEINKAEEGVGEMMEDGEDIREDVENAEDEVRSCRKSDLSHFWQYHTFDAEENSSCYQHTPIPSLPTDTLNPIFPTHLPSQWVPITCPCHSALWGVAVGGSGHRDQGRELKLRSSMMPVNIVILSMSNSCCCSFTYCAAGEAPGVGQGYSILQKAKSYK